MPFLEKVIALRLDTLRQLTGLCVKLQGVRTLVPEEGVAYIECTRTPAIPHYQEFNVLIYGALLVTPAISAFNDLKDYSVNA